MRRNILRLSTWVIIAVLLALMILTACTRSKSSGPPAATSDETGSEVATSPPSAEATSTPGGDPISVTTTAWANETATAEAQSEEDTQDEATATPPPTEVAEPTEPAPTEAPESTETPEATEAPQPTTPPTESQGRVHVVQAGDNLFRIALEYGLTYQALAGHNGITNPNLIYVGQQLSIPGSGEPVQPQPPSQGQSVHVVQAGENLFRVALQYDMTYTALAAANNLAYPYTIYVGQRLVIP